MSDTDALPRPAATSRRRFHPFQLLVLVGMVGTSLTLFTGISGLIRLAAGVRALIDGWKRMTRELWQLLVGWLGIELSAPVAVILNFIVFALVLAIGVRLRIRFLEALGAGGTQSGAQGRMGAPRLVLGIVAGLVLSLAATMISGWILMQMRDGFATESDYTTFILLVLVPLLFLPLLWACYWLLTRPVEHAQSLFPVAVVYSICVLVIPLYETGKFRSLDFMSDMFLGFPVAFSLVFLAMMRLAPAHALRSRLITSLAGTAGLAILNECIRTIWR